MSMAFCGKLTSGGCTRMQATAAEGKARAADEAGAAQTGQYPVAGAAITQGCTDRRDTAAYPADCIWLPN